MRSAIQLVLINFEKQKRPDRDGPDLKSKFLTLTANKHHQEEIAPFGVFFYD